MIKLYGVFFVIILLKKFKLDSKKHEICKTAMQTIDNATWIFLLVIVYY
jgi:hypothetical protein